MLGPESARGDAEKTYGQSFYSINLARKCHLTYGQRIVSGPILLSNIDTLVQKLVMN